MKVCENLRKWDELSICFFADTDYVLKLHRSFIFHEFGRHSAFFGCEISKKCFVHSQLQILVQYAREREI